jgi:L-lactate dehydrogenase complex protein LldG
MSKRTDEWLKQLDEQSLSKQEQFLNGIAAKLNRARVTDKPQHPFRGSPDFWAEFQLSESEKLDMFQRNFEAAGGYVQRAATLSEASSIIVDKANELQALHILRQDLELLGQLGLEQALPNVNVRSWNDDEQEDWKARAAEADIGVVLADYAVAYTGSLTLLSSKTKGRSVSLLPTLLFALIPKSSLVTKLGEVLSTFDEMGRANLPAGIHFVSGPSRSADIENDLTIGVHGPGIVYAVIIDDI